VYKEMEKEYVEKIETPMLEEKKKMLQSIRDMKKPINHQEIMGHCKSYATLREKDIEVKNRRIA